MLTTIADNLALTLAKISAAERQFARPAGAVKLLAVSKSQSVERIQAAALAGQTDFGENYLQEALPKIAVLVNSALCWHFIGTIQTKKIKLIAAHFAWVHSVFSWAQAEQLNRHRPALAAPLNICLQLNLDQETTKAGLTLADLPLLAKRITELPNLTCRGLMAIPAPRLTFAAQCASFTRLRLALQNLTAQGLRLDTLSMGMSADYNAAIAAGATLVRIGTAIFGDRPERTG